MSEVDHNWDDGVTRQQGAEKSVIAEEAYEGCVRQDWTHEEIKSLYELSFNELILRAQLVHRQHFNPDQIQMSRLLSIKTGGCPEDCAYCPQSAHYKTDVSADKLLAADTILEEAQRAKESGASRFWTNTAHADARSTRNWVFVTEEQRRQAGYPAWDRLRVLVAPTLMNNGTDTAQACSDLSLALPCSRRPSPPASASPR